MDARIAKRPVVRTGCGALSGVGVGLTECGPCVILYDEGGARMTNKQVLNRLQESIADCVHEWIEREKAGELDTRDYLDGKLYAYKHALALLTGV